MTTFEPSLVRNVQNDIKDQIRQRKKAFPGEPLLSQVAGEFPFSPPVHYKGCKILIKPEKFFFLRTGITKAGQQAKALWRSYQAPREEC